MRDRDVPLGAFQSGGYIGNGVACGLLLVFNGRALWKFHESGGLHGKKDGTTVPLLAESDDEADPDFADLNEAKKKDKAAVKAKK